MDAEVDHASKIGKAPIGSASPGIAPESLHPVAAELYSSTKRPAFLPAQFAGEVLAGRGQYFGMTGLP
jgi:hypothetical protein